MAQKNYAPIWKQVDSLSDMGQVQTAQQLVVQIYDETRAANQPDQFLKASLYRIALQSKFEESFYKDAIARTLADINTAPSPVKQILHSIAADLYWRYYQQNQWKINERSVIQGSAPEDFETWDLKKFVETCRYHYLQSLTEEKTLMKTPIGDFDAILLKGKDSKIYRPTLFDFLAYRAVDFYSSEEADITRPANAFVMNDAALFGPANMFAEMPLLSADTLSYKYMATKLYQQILQFHLNDSDPTALIDADLARLSFIHNHSVSADKDKLFENALRKLEEKYRNHPSVTDIVFVLAGQLSANASANAEKSDKTADKWAKKDALSLLENTVKRFPDSRGAAGCNNMIAEIKRPLLTITTNETSTPDKPALALVEYTNLSKIYFRLLEIPLETDKKYRELEYDRMVSAYFATKPVIAWEQALQNDGDYLSHSTEVRIPAAKAAHYVLLASNNPDFQTLKDILIVNRFWKTNISYLSTGENTGQTRVIVLDRNNGQPIAGASVQKQFYYYNNKEGRYATRLGDVYYTDKQGEVLLNKAKTENRWERYDLIIAYKKDKYISETNYSSYYNIPDEPKTYTQTHLFTDRSIYRPGQTVYFKGIVLECTGENVKIKPNFSANVRLIDVNGQKVSEQTLKTNEFGSFSGTFTLPQGVLTGQMEISTEDGNVNFNVEEYKRPKFEVTFDAVKDTYKLNETITAKGKATTYAGNSVGGAKVKYRVVRKARFPYWGWWWRGFMPESPEMEITQGETQTADDGSFMVNFQAIPDLSIEKSKNPVFDYEITADITDINGESHSAESLVSVGYTALLVKTDLDNDVNLEKGLSFTLSTTNLNQQPVAAKGQITVAKLRKPNEVLFERKWKQPDIFTLSREEFKRDFPNEVYDNEDDITTWPVEKTVYQKAFSTPADSLVLLDAVKDGGTYLVEITTTDNWGEKVAYKKYINAFQPKTNTIETVSPAFFTLLNPNALPGETVKCLIGSPCENVNALLEVIHRDEIVEHRWISLNKEKRIIEIPVKEEYRGNFGINFTFVKNGRMFNNGSLVKVPYDNKKLDITFASFRSKLQPGQDEEWTITLHDNKGETVAAEMLASMYDASLDVFQPHAWDFNIFSIYPNFYRQWSNGNFGVDYSESLVQPNFESVSSEREYDRLNWFGFESWYGGGRRGSLMMTMKSEAVYDMAQPAPLRKEVLKIERQARALGNSETVIEGAFADKVIKTAKGEQVISVEKPEKAPVQIRKNFNETAFFYPQLATNDKGEVVIKFKMPEALTRWKMMGLAYTKDLKIGQVEKTLVTQKELMLFTNVPRFLREGDQMDFAAKISNIGVTDINGTVELQFFDAITMQPVNDKMGLGATVIPFAVAKGASTPVSWKIKVPEGLQAVVYRIVATAGVYSDGEEAALPVFTNRMLVTESLPLPVRGNQQKTFTFDKLLQSGNGTSTLRNYRLTLEYTSNPAWYAVQALPYLMEYPYECAEQIFSRYYANSLATHIANSNPKIKRVFESWKNLSPDALKSNLNKNEELKAVLLQESPWVREAANESERKQRIALLFDFNRMAAEQSAAVKKLSDMQSGNGGWPWFKGMPESRYITQHIVAGLGHLEHLKVKAENDEVENMLQNAIAFIDQKAKSDFNKMKANDKDYLKNNHLGYVDIHYLYARSFNLANYPLPEECKEMVSYYAGQTTKYWKTQSNYSKGMMALYLNRMGNQKVAALILRSLKETALHNDEMGMYWRNMPRGWFWYEAPVETQALLIEAFDEVGNDAPSVEEMKVWLLKQKQTQDWKTTKATAEAVYAMLLRGTDLLASDKLVDIKLGNESVNSYKIDAAKPEAGSGYFKTAYNASDIKPQMGKVTVTNPNPTVAWGALYWQYFEQLDKITPAETPLKLNKKLFREVNTANGMVIEPITEATPLKVGDKVVVRVELRSDRDMEYVHLKDMRASAFEPVNVLSGYRWQGGLGYYESTRDAATNFFIDYLPKGTYVFEYKLTATQKGDFSNGITSAQCMYAPEFATHSEGIRVKVE